MYQFRELFKLQFCHTPEKITKKKHQKGLPIAFNDNLGFNSKCLICVKKCIGHTTGISTRFEYFGVEKQPH